MNPIVSIIMGSTSDLPVLESGIKFLDEMGIPFEMNALSAHRTPELVEEFARNAQARGIKVIIAAAGMAAHLPGVIAAMTPIPEIERCIVRKGDLLICEGGDVGRAAIWDYDYNIMIQNHIHRLRGKVDICTRYFFYLFMHYKLHNLIGGKGVAIQGLSSRDLHNLIIPVPSLKEQYDIASSIDLYFSKLDMITAEL